MTDEERLKIFEMVEKLVPRLAGLAQRGVLPADLHITGYEQAADHWSVNVSYQLLHPEGGNVTHERTLVVSRPDYEVRAWLRGR